MYRRVTALCAGLILFPGVTASQPGPQTVRNIPVIVNIYPNAGISEQEARDAVATASRILREQLGVGMTVVEVKSVKAGEAGDDGDGRLTGKEGKAVRRHGAREVQGDQRTKDQGLKISFVDDPHTGHTGDWGLSRHRSPTLIIKKRPAEDPVARSTGATIAHEACHVLTLSGNYEWTTGENTDRQGHIPRGHGTGNLMHGDPEERTGTTLTDKQKAKIRRDRLLPIFSVGTRVPLDGRPARNEALHFGAAVDAVEDVGAPRDYPSDLYDLEAAWLTAEQNVPDLRVHVVTAGSVADLGQVPMVLTVAFDVDNNPRTGTRSGFTEGMDRVLQLRPNGEPTDDVVPLEVSLRTLPDGAPSPLDTRAVVLTDLLIVDGAVRDGEPGVSEPAGSSFILSLPVDDLGFRARRVPVVIGTGDGTRFFDDTSLIFDRKRSKRAPQLRPSGVPVAGTPYRLQVKWLTPRTRLDIFMDDRLMRTVTLNRKGAWRGSFRFPAQSDPSRIHHLTAIDAEGHFAFSATSPKPEMSD